MDNTIKITYTKQGMEILHPSGVKQTLLPAKLEELVKHEEARIVEAQERLATVKSYLSKATTASLAVEP